MKMWKRNGINLSMILSAAAGGAMLALPTAAKGADRNWISTATDAWWSVGTNWWQNGTPIQGDNAIIVNRGATNYNINYLNVNGANVTLHDLVVKSESTGRVKLILRSDTPHTLKTTYDWIYSQGWNVVRQEAGVHETSQMMYLGYAGTGARATYELVNGLLDNKGEAHVGGSGLGDFNQTGGTHLVGGTLSIDSPDKNWQSTYGLHGGTLTAGEIRIGQYGSGSFDHGWGNVTTGNFYLGDGTNSFGYYQLYSISNLTANGYTYIGNYGQGQVQMYGGNVSLQSLFIGRNAGANGSWTMKNGAMTSTLCIIGDGGAYGTFLQEDGHHQANTLRIGGAFGSMGSYYLVSPGSLTINSYLSVGSSGTGQFGSSGRVSVVGNLVVGEYGTSSGNMWMNAGTLNVGGTTAVGSPMGGGGGAVTGGNGTLSIGGGVANLTGIARVGEGTFSNGFLNVTGGVLNSSTITIGISGGKGTINHSGGTINATGALILGSGPGSTGSLNLSDTAILRPSRLIVGDNGGNGTFNQTGGFFGPLSRITIGNNGAYNLSAGTFYGSVSEVNGLYNQTGGWAGLAFLNGSGTARISGGTAYVFHANGANTIDIREGGHLKLDSGAGQHYGASTIKALAIAKNGSGQYTGSFDLTDDGLIIDYTDGGPSPLAEVRQMLKQGYNNGVWNGKGVHTTFGDAAHGIGYVESAELFGTFPAMFQKKTVDGSAVLMTYTYFGDTNLDGQVDITDLGNLATNWQSTGVNWLRGDFNYDGVVDISDLGALATNWQAGISPSQPGMSFSEALAVTGLPSVSVPEPGMAAAMLAVGLGAPRRVRRRGQTGC